MAVLISSKLGSSRERAEFTAILTYARAYHDADGAKVRLEFADGERNFNLNLTAEEFRAVLSGALGVDPRKLALVAGATP